MSAPDFVVTFLLGPFALLYILLDGWMTYVTADDPTRLGYLLVALLGTTFYAVVLGRLAALRG